MRVFRLKLLHFMIQGKMDGVARWLSPHGALKLALLGWTLRATRAACARVAAALAAGGAVVYDASS